MPTRSDIRDALEAAVTPSVVPYVSRGRGNAIQSDKLPRAHIYFDEGDRERTTMGGDPTFINTDQFMVEIYTGKTSSATTEERLDTLTASALAAIEGEDDLQGAEIIDAVVTSTAYDASEEGEAHYGVARLTVTITYTSS